ncbi:MAG: DNA gyrase inhibitor YacG [Burkholderiaceae bacterium]
MLPSPNPSTETSPSRLNSATSDRDPPSKTLVVACPKCARDSVFAPSNRYRPFCSERCKLNDLGDWASDRYRLAGEEMPGEDEH